MKRLLPALAITLAVAASVRARADEPKDARPAPPGAAEGDYLDVDGTLYEVRDGKLVPLTAESLQVEGVGTPATIAKTAEVVTVTASRLETAPNASAVNTRVVGQAEIVERGARNLGDLLKQEAGVQVNSSLGVGSEVYMDGLDGRSVLILVDGRPLTGRVNSRVDLSRVPISPSMVERVEITRGPMSALYGSDAMGGVINIITRRPRPGVGGEASLDTVLIPRQPAQVSLSANAFGAAGALSGRAGFSFLRAYPYDLGHSDVRSGVATRYLDGVGDAPGKRQVMANAEAGYQLGSTAQVRAYGSATRLDVETWARSTVPFRDSNASHQLTGGTVLQVEPWLGHLFTLDGRVDGFSHTFQKLPGSTTPGQEFCEATTPRLRLAFDARCRKQPQLNSVTDQLNARLETRVEAPVQLDRGLFENLSVVLGGTLEGDHATRRDGDGNDTLQGARTRGVASLFGELLFIPAWFITVLPGVRAEVFAPGAGGRSAEVALNPKISTRVDLPFGFAARASYGEGFRLPSFQERFLVFDHSEMGYIVQGNPGLKPEKSRGARAELVWLRPHWRISVEGFLNLLDNLISESGGTTTNDAGIPIFTYANVARAYTAGVNASASIIAFLGFGVDLNYQYLFNAVDASRCPRSNPYFCSPAQGATSLPLRSPHAVQLKGRWTAPVTGTVLFVQGSFLDARPLGENRQAPAYTVLGAGFRQPFLDHTELFATLDNLLDVRHPTFGPKPGRNLMLSFRSWF